MTFNSFYQLDTAIHKIIGGAILDEIVELTRKDIAMRARKTTERAQKIVLDRWNNILDDSIIPNITAHRPSYILLVMLKKEYRHRITYWQGLNEGQH